MIFHLYYVVIMKYIILIVADCINLLLSFVELAEITSAGLPGPLLTSQYHPLLVVMILFSIVRKLVMS